MRSINGIIVAGLLLLGCVVPVLGQDEAQEKDEPKRVIEDPADRAIRELFRDLELQVEGEADARDRFEEMRRRIMELQLEQNRNRVLLEPQRAAEPIQLDAEPYVSPWQGRSREDVVAALNHADFAVRESAQAFLLMDDTLDQDALQSLIDQAQAPEQRQRLLRVAEHHVLREMRERDFGSLPKAGEEEDPGPFPRASRPASVGYSYEPVLAHENPYSDLAGVAVTATMPGFPGHAHLRPGDIIVQIAGHTFSQAQQQIDITNWVRWRISAHQAGETIRFTVLREGKFLAIEMVCAEGIALDHMYTTDVFQMVSRKEPYKKAWDQAREALTANLPKPITLTPKMVEPAE